MSKKKNLNKTDNKKARENMFCNEINVSQMRYREVI